MPQQKSIVSFTVKRSPRSRQFRCVVRNEGNHEITLSGEPCKNRVDVLSTINEHVEAIKSGRFVVIDATKPKTAPKVVRKRKRCACSLNRNWP